MSCGPCGACKSNATVWLVEVPAHDGDLVAMCMMSVSLSGLNVAAMCAGIVSVMSALGCRAVWAEAERVGLREDRFSFRGAAAVAIDHC